MSAPWGALPLLADKSAWVRAGRRPELWEDAMRRGQIVICGLVQLELLCSARTRDDVLALRGELSALRDLPITRSHLDAAIAALVELAAGGSDGAHRVPPADAVIAACAADHACAVLHYDRHYDRLAGVLGFESVWLAPAGELA